MLKFFYERPGYPISSEKPFVSYNINSEKSTMGQNLKYMGDEETLNHLMEEVAFGVRIPSAVSALSWIFLCLQIFSYLIFNRDRFIHPLSTNLRSNRKRNSDSQGSTFVLTILTTISKTMYPIRTETIHSRLPNVCLLTTVFFVVSPHKLWMLRVVKK